MRRTGMANEDEDRVAIVKQLLWKQNTTSTVLVLLFG